MCNKEYSDSAHVLVSDVSDITTIADSPDLVGLPGFPLFDLSDNIDFREVVRSDFDDDSGAFPALVFDLLRLMTAVIINCYLEKNLT